jgi:hypothetical protein
MCRGAATRGRTGKVRTKRYGSPARYQALVTDRAGEARRGRISPARGPRNRGGAGARALGRHRQGHAAGAGAMTAARVRRPRNGAVLSDAIGLPHRGANEERPRQRWGPSRGGNASQRGAEKYLIRLLIRLQK